MYSASCVFGYPKTNLPLPASSPDQGRGSGKGVKNPAQLGVLANWLISWLADRLAKEPTTWPAYY
ncbi:hypothetical protein DU508_21610 [Pedobacter chinensis]|uniref:Uncharacterized protein n=1 Tax=Pedobacter chinensis TaxID=2282421 RepID=A0A369PNY8_9SPHI|nr:hypothetical protein DU508_21610 [Pedobacter chinensis]